MAQKKEYFAFISYSHKDSEMAKWLQHEFGYYELPATLFDERKDLRKDKENFPESLRPIFCPTWNGKPLNGTTTLIIMANQKAKSDYIRIGNNMSEKFENHNLNNIIT